jgi:hypothetical protein
MPQCQVSGTHQVLIHPPPLPDSSSSPLVSRRAVRLGVVTAIAVVIVGGVFAVAKSKGGPQYVDVALDFQDFGVGKPNELLRGSLAFRNVGDQPLTFSVSASCACTDLNPREGLLAPGESQTIRLAVRLPEYSNSKRVVDVVITTNDPRNSSSIYNFTAECPAPFLTVPAYLNFGTVSRQSLTDKSLTITLRPNAEEIDLSFLDVRHDRDFFHVERINGTENCMYRVTLSDTPNMGDLYDTLEFRSPATSDVIRVPVRARIFDRVSITPSTLVLRRKDSGDGFEPINIILSTYVDEIDAAHVRLHDESLLRIDRTEPLGKYRWRIKLSVAGEIGTEPFDVRFVIPNMETAGLKVFPLLKEITP